MTGIGGTGGFRSYLYNPADNTCSAVQFGPSNDVLQDIFYSSFSFAFVGSSSYQGTTKDVGICSGAGSSSCEIYRSQFVNMPGFLGPSNTWKIGLQATFCFPPSASQRLCGRVRIITELGLIGGYQIQYSGLQRSPPGPTLPAACQSAALDAALSRQVMRGLGINH